MRYLVAVAHQAVKDHTDSKLQFDSSSWFVRVKFGSVSD
jgi:hypothetical protein